jgi:hypothetical protein
MKRRDSNLTIRLTNREKANLKLKCEDTGLSVSDYVRHLIISSPKNLKKTAFEKRVLWLLIRLYFSNKEKWLQEFDRATIDKHSQETEDLIKKWEY